MSRRLLAVAATSSALLLGSGCPSPGPQPFSTELHGQLRSSTAAALPNPVHLAMGWYPIWFGMPVVGPRVAFDTHETTYSGSFPVDFTFDLQGAPPAMALVDLTASGGRGKIAVGFLVAFEDGNGNGLLDTGTTGNSSPDRIVGISEADLTLPPPPHHYLVVYLEGRLGPDDSFADFKLHQGYNLLQVHNDYGVDLVPPETSIELEVTRTDALQFFGCAEADYQLGYRTACGIDPFGGNYRISSGVLDGRLGMELRIEVGSGVRSDATVLLNGTALTFEPLSAMYSGALPIVGANTVQIDVPGYPAETINANVPRPVALTTSFPAELRSGSTLTLAWSDDPVVQRYTVRVFGANDFKPLFFAAVDGTSVTTDPINYTGQARVIVKGVGPMAVGSHGGFVTPLNRFDGYINFTL